MSGSFWKWFWRGVGAVAVIFMTITTALFWTAWRASPFKPSGDGKVIESGIDVIAIQLDILSLIIAVIGIGLAVMSFLGYQAIKDAAIARADAVATKAMALHMENIERTMRGLQSGPGNTAAEPENVLELTEEEKGV